MIPLLIDGATMPTEAQLPDVLRPLARRSFRRRGGNSTHWPVEFVARRVAQGPSAASPATSPACSRPSVRPVANAGTPAFERELLLRGDAKFTIAVMPTQCGLARRPGRNSPAPQRGCERAFLETTCQLKLNLAAAQPHAPATAAAHSRR